MTDKEGVKKAHICTSFMNDQRKFLNLINFYSIALIV